VFRRNKELWLALAAVLIVTVFYYLYVAANGFLPPASKLVGHGIGILGFVLMLLTETLYTLRKRAKSARWGKVSSWLKFHIFTGLVGPYLVLLHPALRFRGVAAVLTLLTIVVVASGVVGRYIYTRVPRAVETERPEMDTAPAAAGEEAAAVPIALQTGVPAPVGAPWPQFGHAEPRAMEVPASRKGLAVWRMLHVPLTFVLFAVSLVHIVGAVYYATLLH
jgi:Na+-transporting methylmalonyl-CoA/oxaloacetate decarboxylase gamma subunit